MKTLLIVITLLYLQAVEGRQNCNQQLEGKIVSFESNYYPGYQVGLYNKNLGRAGIELRLSLVWAGTNLKPETLWKAEKCREQLCFSRMKYNAKKLGDYYKEIADEKNYFYMTRFNGLRVDHVWGSDIEKWKGNEPSESASFSPGFDVFCNSCRYGLTRCTVETKKNKIGKWNADKIGKMMATGSGDYVQFDDEGQYWTIKTHENIPSWYLAPSSGWSANLNLALWIAIIFLTVMR